MLSEKLVDERDFRQGAGKEERNKYGCSGVETEGWILFTTAS
jgi:hypothetical protein